MTLCDTPVEATVAIVKYTKWNILCLGKMKDSVKFEMRVSNEAKSNVFGMF